MSSIVYGADKTLNTKLQAEHDEIEIKYSTVNQLRIHEFEQLDKQEVIVFDIRKEKEFLVSNIDGAFQVDPDMQPQDFLTLYGDKLIGKKVIYYCSVGWRSTKFAAKVSQSVSPAISSQSYNLVGGIFHWHNLEKPLISNGEVTQAIHPYNVFWGRLIDRKEHIRRNK